MDIFADYESFKSTMTKEEVLLWFQKRLNRAPEAFDVYQVRGLLTKGCKGILSARLLFKGIIMPSTICIYHIKIGFDGRFNYNWPSFVGLLLCTSKRTRKSIKRIQKVRKGYV
jgi:hypothetical protein